MLDTVIEDGRAWTRDSVKEEDWLVSLSPKALEELDALVESLRRDPLPILMLSHEQFRLKACGKIMETLRGILTEGIGVAVLGEMPLERYTLEEAKAAYWVLGQFIGAEVAQKWDGTMLYDVTNTGAPLGYGVRRSWTDLELFFHTDNAFAVAPPDIVSLLCLYPAREGGISRFCSLYTVHNEMLKRHPRLLRRLYEPLYFDRQAEHAPNDPKVSRSPVFRYDGKKLKARMAAGLIRRGYDLLGIEPDAEARDALDAADEIMNDPNLWIEFRIERGQMQYLNNWETAHFRSKIEDHEDPALKRHLIRLWYRGEGRRSYNG